DSEAQAKEPAFARDSGLGTREAQAEEPTFARNSRLATREATPSLFGIVQGGMYPELRRESAERTVEIGFAGYAIGGLSVGEPRQLTEEVLSAALPHLP